MYGIKDGVENVVEKKYDKLTKRQQLILTRIRESATTNVVENVVESNVTLANYFGVNTRTIQRDLNVLQTEGFLRHVGPDKGGHWEVVER